MLVILSRLVTFNYSFIVELLIDDVPDVVVQGIQIRRGRRPYIVSDIDGRRVLLEHVHPSTQCKDSTLCPELQRWLWGPPVRNGVVWYCPYCSWLPWPSMAIRSQCVSPWIALWCLHRANCHSAYSPCQFQEAGYLWIPVVDS